MKKEIKNMKLQHKLLQLQEKNLQLQRAAKKSTSTKPTATSTKIKKLQPPSTDTITINNESSFIYRNKQNVTIESRKQSQKRFEDKFLEKKSNSSLNSNAMDGSKQLGGKQSKGEGKVEVSEMQMSNESWLEYQLRQLREKRLREGGCHSV